MNYILVIWLTELKLLKKALEIYSATRSKTIDQLRTDSKTDTNLKIKAAQNFEPGSVSHMGTIKNTITNYSNINELADNLFPDATSAQMTDTIIPLLNDNQKRYNLVKNVINQKTNLNQVHLNQQAYQLTCMASPTECQ